ncbi:hypothetical protein F5B17DRAFT_389829 [Nemania serpens]|nr:hypothetical protein F5B17DRAFT_389829 [Nemania serpens]
MALYAVIPSLASSVSCLLLLLTQTPKSLEPFILLVLLTSLGASSTLNALDNHGSVLRIPYFMSCHRRRLSGAYFCQCLPRDRTAALYRYSTLVSHQSIFSWSDTWSFAVSYIVLGHYYVFIVSLQH